MNETIDYLMKQYSATLHELKTLAVLMRETENISNLLAEAHRRAKTADNLAMEAHREKRDQLMAIMGKLQKLGVHKYDQD